MGIKLLGFSIGRGSGALKGLKAYYLLIFTSTVRGVETALLSTKLGFSIEYSAIHPRERAFSLAWRTS